MGEPLTERDRAIFEKPALAYLATIGPRGWPQVTPTWVDLEGDLIRINTARGRVKDRNMGADPRVAVTVSDPDEPRARVAVQGRVVDASEEGAEEHINQLSWKYEGKDYDPLPDGMVRVIYRIEPVRISHA